MARRNLSSFRTQVRAILSSQGADTFFAPEDDDEIERCFAVKASVEITSDRLIQMRA